MTPVPADGAGWGLLLRAGAFLVVDLVEHFGGQVERGQAAEQEGQPGYVVSLLLGGVGAHSAAGVEFRGGGKTWESSTAKRIVCAVLVSTIHI